MILVPHRFRQRVAGHGIAATIIEGHPLVLALEGPAGDGKSFQAKTVLSAAGFTVTRASSSLLSGSWEGEPITQLRQLYESAVVESDIHDTWPAIILEDFDMSPASIRSAETRYTVNSQLLTGFLMNLAEDPATAVGTTRRVPLILTGNDLSYLYGPLTRPGRVDFFVWRPTSEERAEMIFSTLTVNGINATPRDARRLEARFKSASIATFAAATNECLAARLRAAVPKDHGVASVVGLRRAAVRDMWLGRREEISLGEIEDVLEARHPTPPFRWIGGR